MFSKIRLLAPVAMLAAAALMPMSTQAEPQDLVYICHVSGSANDVHNTPAAPAFGIPAAQWVFGQLMQVNAHAVDAHVGHGDSAMYHPIPAPTHLDGAFWLTAELVGQPFPFGQAWANVFAAGQFPNADCGIRHILD